jgi:hypothetical protein
MAAEAEVKKSRREECVDERFMAEAIFADAGLSVLLDESCR